MEYLSVTFNGNSDGISVGKRHGNSDGMSVGDCGTAVNIVNDTTIPTDKFSL